MLFVRHIRGHDGLYRVNRVLPGVINLIKVRYFSDDEIRKRFCESNVVRHLVEKTMNHGDRKHFEHTVFKTSLKESSYNSLARNIYL